jgi:hypothetical protein
MFVGASPLVACWRNDELARAMAVVNVRNDDGDARSGQALEGQLQCATTVVLRPVLTKVSYSFICQINSSLKNVN